MNEFIGRLMYPFGLFSLASCNRTSVERFTNASMSLTGTAKSLVKTDSGASRGGPSALLDLFFLSFLRGPGDLVALDLPLLNGESVLVLAERPLRVRTPSLVVDRGVGALCT